jgi:hypothetical protein
LARWGGSTALTALALGYVGLEGEAAEKTDWALLRPVRMVTEIDPDGAVQRSLRLVSLETLRAREGAPSWYEFPVDEFFADEVAITLVRAPEGAAQGGSLPEWSPGRAQAGQRQWLTLREADPSGRDREQTWGVAPRAGHLHDILAGPRHRH